MKFTLRNHIIGNTYDLTQENFNAVISEMESLEDQLEWSIKNEKQYKTAFREAAERVSQLTEGRREQAKAHQEDARCWQIERSRLRSALQACYDGWSKGDDVVGPMRAACAILSERTKQVTYGETDVTRPDEFAPENVKQVWKPKQSTQQGHEGAIGSRKGDHGANSFTAPPSQPEHDPFRALRFHGCLTGDCPHNSQRGCSDSLGQAVREAYAETERAEPECAHAVPNGEHGRCSACDYERKKK